MEDPGPVDISNLCKKFPRSTTSGKQHATTITSRYRVFYHDLLITKLHYIDYKIKLMACFVQKIYFMATRKSNYLNEM